MAKYLENLDKELIYAHYNRPEILKAILGNAQGKEVVGSFGGTGYAKRPDTIFYEQDILSLVKQGITSFHCSEETWNDPMRLQPGMSRNDLEALRIGWDLIIDVDCVFLEYSKLAADLIVQALEHYSIKNISVKFSGNHGFHIGVPFESMPEFIDGKQTKTLFPQAARLIAELLKEFIEGKIDLKTGRGKLADAIWRYEAQGSSDEQQIMAKIIEKTSVPHEKLVRRTKTEDGYDIDVFNAFELLEIDTILISSRHLCRMVYSVNEKSGLVSLPINPKKILEFNRDVARIENKIISRFTFLERSKSIPGEATQLLREAFDRQYSEQTVVGDDKKVASRTYEDIRDAIPEIYFPPMIKKLLEGNLRDGRKRAVFVLGAFLFSVGWTEDAVSERIHIWNKTHPEGLRDAYIRGQIKHLASSKTLPPNFSVIAEYFGYDKELIPAKMKNPVNFSRSQYRKFVKSNAVQPKLTDEQKAKRKAFRDKQKAMSKMPDENNS